MKRKTEKTLYKMAGMRIKNVFINALLCFMCTSQFANGSVGAGATVHNMVVLQHEIAAVPQPTYAVSNEAFVSLLAVAPQLLAQAAAIDGNAQQSMSLDFIIRNLSNGEDTFSISSASLDTNISLPTLSPVANITLGASNVSDLSVLDNQLFIAAGSENGLSVGDSIYIDDGSITGTYEIVSVVPGIPATSDTNGNFINETPTEILLTPLTGPVIPAGALAIGQQFGEQIIVSLNLVTGNPTASGAAHQIDLTATSTSNSSSSTLATTLISIGVQIEFSKDARNISAGSRSYLAEGLVVEQGDIIEYRLRITASPGNRIKNSYLADNIPANTLYIPGTTRLNNEAIADVSGNDFPLSSDSGLLVNDPGSTAGLIRRGRTATVTFQVCVGDLLSECEAAE